MMKLEVVAHRLENHHRHERGQYRCRSGMRGDSNLSRTDEKLVGMTNGCICCTVRDALLQEVKLLVLQE